MAPTIPPQTELRGPLHDEEECIKFLFENNIIINPSSCSVQNCGGRISRYRTTFQCTRRNCRKKQSIFQNSFFANNRLKCQEILFLGYLWLCKAPSKMLQLVCGHSSATICEYEGHFRTLVTEALDADDTIIGGPGIVVELDESKFARRKNNRGHHVEGAWVIGGVERTDDKLVFAEIVENRSSDTIRDVISRHVAMGSIIHTDCWRGYSWLQDSSDYSHFTVNHSVEFVDSATGVHTNGIEGSWAGMKRGIAPRNRTKMMLEKHLLEYIWRKKHRNNLWSAFIYALSIVGYPGTEE